MSDFFGRTRELKRLHQFLEKEGAGFTYVRGRRRIGKSTLLKKIQAQYRNCFYFQGADDAGEHATLRDFAARWDSFAGEGRLTQLKAAVLDWHRIFSEILEYARRSNDALILIFDEIQWIAKLQSGFLGALKEAWLDWKKTKSIKVILSGSSNKFFSDYAGGAEAVLRGLKTAAEIWVKPFTLAEVKEYYCPHWTHEQVCLLYMMLGGIPYYLEQIPYGEKNFLRAVNSGIFLQDSIFLEEVGEVLGLEVSRSGSSYNNLMQVLACLGQDGSTEARIVEKTGVTQNTVHQILEKLEKYGIVRVRRPFGENKRNRRGAKFYMPDFFLNFYFQVLDGLQTSIRRNSRGMLFNCECIKSNIGYYIPNFSGKAFELLLAAVLEDRDDLSPPIFKKLALCDGDYEVGMHWEEGRTQVDLIVQSTTDREARIIEAKWISAVDSGYLAQVKSRKYTPPPEYTKSYYLALSRGFSQGLIKAAAAEGIRVIELEDLFGT